MRRVIATYILFMPFCDRLFSQSPLFTVVDTRESGIGFVNEIKENDALNVLAYEYFYNGGGVAIGDINNDRWPDIFFTANIKSNKLYLNKGGFKFEDITRSSKTSGRKDWKTGVTMADVNGDGWLDIYVCYSGKGQAASRRNELYINNRDLSFSEKAVEYGLDDTGCSTQAIFFDYDRDGDLDCYVLNHNIRAYKNIELQYLKMEYDALAADKLYRNDKGHFTDVSKTAGISGNPLSFGLGVAVSDINNDGWPDIYVSNDYAEQDYCYINNGNGTFTAREQELFSHLSQFSMGSDIADINNDGWVDILTLDMLPEDNRRQKLLQAQENYELYQGMVQNGFHYQFMRNMLHLNNGNGTFSEIGQLAGISNTDWSWAPLWADFDNDGFKDLFITTGYMRDYTNKDFLKYWGDYLVKQAVNRDSINYLEIIRLMPVTLLKNYAFRNKGDLRFQNVSASWGLDLPALSNGAAYADLDNDGDLDLLINNINAVAGVYRNNLSSATAHYLDVRLAGNDHNKYAIGTKAWCYTQGRVQLLEQMMTRGYQSSVDERLHFGLGAATLVDSLVLQWPNGKVQVIRDVKADQVLTVTQDNGNISPATIQKEKQSQFFSVAAPLFQYQHSQMLYNDFKRQPLMPVMLSYSGPVMAKGDLNGDGRDDIFIGSEQGQSSILFIQQPGGNFLQQELPAFTNDKYAVTTAIVLFDADNDKDTDIYCASGGYHDLTAGDERLTGRLFRNDGAGKFSLVTAAFPSTYDCSTAAAAADIDGDGDIDLFTGGGTVPGNYPEPATSHIWLNDGKGKFTDATRTWITDISRLGRITDAVWTDINKDNKPDLMLCGEWTPLKILLNNGHSLELYDAGLNNASGWWNCITLFDADKDGDLDIIAGNWGLNSQIRASPHEPAEMYWLDADRNGSVDPFLCFYMDGISWPYISRDELLDQAYMYRKKFTSYKSYAEAKLTDILTPAEMSEAKKLHAVTLATSFFENNNGKFIQHPLPAEAQFTPVYKILAEDINGDGYPDLLLFGNNDHPRLKIGKIDAGFGTVLINNGDYSFRNAGATETGLSVKGDVRDAEILQTSHGRYLLIGVNSSDGITLKIGQ